MPKPEKFGQGYFLPRISDMNGKFGMVSESALDEICLEQKQTPTKISLHDRPKTPARLELLPL
ncbi:hypothetical protein C7B80_05665 [Cyanosarcina cf. burmensis CCALA 770]|nr:hypothetical protein C7B80_05665 [Cyanosarcina cf. burmensis CCALA 770]